MREGAQRDRTILSLSPDFNAVLQVSGNTWRTGHGFELPKAIFNTGATSFYDFLAHRFIRIYNKAGISLYFHRFVSDFHAFRER
jgi:hypothetical protein